jgi:Tol biopolymer transport system component
MSATISADGRFVAFVSDSSHLVPGDTNGESDVFVRDLQEGTTERVSVNDDGTQAVGNAGDPEISGDGRFVSFWSGSNLDPSVPDVPGGGEFVRDRVAGTTEWVTDDEVAAISDKGRFVAFVSTRQLSPDDTDDAYDVYVLDRRSGTTSLASTEGYLALEISMSDNGRFVAYDARATARAKVRQVYVRDMRGGTTTIASVNSRGVRGDGESFDPVLSRSGRYVAFGSFAHNLGRRTGPRALYYGHDLRTDVTRAISVNSSGAAANQRAWNMVEAPVAVSATGDIVAFVSHATNLVRHDTNERFDVFVRERR